MPQSTTPPDEGAMGTDAEAVAAATRMLARTQSASLAMINAVQAQQNAAITANATVAVAVARILRAAGGDDVTREAASKKAAKASRSGRA